MIPKLSHSQSVDGESKWEKVGDQTMNIRFAYAKYSLEHKWWESISLSIPRAPFHIYYYTLVVCDKKQEILSIHPIKWLKEI